MKSLISFKVFLTVFLLSKYVTSQTPDNYAIEEALIIKEKLGEGEVVIVSQGPLRVQKVIREGLAKKILELLQESKAEEIVLIDVRETSNLADYLSISFRREPCLIVVVVQQYIIVYFM